MFQPLSVMTPPEEASDPLPRPRRGLAFATSGAPSFGGEGLLLDIERGRYISLSKTSTIIWQEIEQSAPIEAVLIRLSEELSMPRERAIRILSKQIAIWKEQGLVGARLEVPRSAVPAVKPARAPGTPMDLARFDAAPFSASDLPHFIRAGLDIALRWRRGFAATLVYLESVPVRPAAADVTGIYRAAKTLFVARRLYGLRAPDCLRRSLVLALVLRRRGILADVCIGVRKRPFFAHAWVEAEGMAIDYDRLFAAASVLGVMDGSIQTIARF